MQTILIACRSQESAEAAMRVAADLSAACGARLTLAHLPPAPRVLTAAAGVDAVGRLSDVLFMDGDPLLPCRTFGQLLAPRWLSGMAERVGHTWSAADLDGLVEDIAVRRPDLVITGDSDLAAELIGRTSVPVWRARRAQPAQSWFLIRKLRCAVRGSRASAWARSLGAALGADVETTPARLFAADDADLVVVAREERASLLQTRFARAFVVV